MNDCLYKYGHESDLYCCDFDENGVVKKVRTKALQRYHFRQYQSNISPFRGHALIYKSSIGAIIHTIIGCLSTESYIRIVSSFCYPCFVRLALQVRGRFRSNQSMRSIHWILFCPSDRVRSRPNQNMAMDRIHIKSERFNVSQV